MPFCMGYLLCNYYWEDMKSLETLVLSKVGFLPGSGQETFARKQPSSLSTKSATIHPWTPDVLLSWYMEKYQTIVNMQAGFALF